METPLKPNVLFLEDDVDTRDMVKFTLEQAGMNVIAVESVDDAWLAALGNKFDLFLLDGLIPHGDSLKLCRDLRALEPDKQVVFYSGLAFAADIKKGMDAGANAYFIKPFLGDLAEEMLHLIYSNPQHKRVTPLALPLESVPGIVDEAVIRIDEPTTRPYDVQMLFDSKEVPSSYTTPKRGLRGVRARRRAGGIV